MAVVSFTRPFTTLIFTLSPMLTLKGGHGHCPLIPMNGRVNPSGAAFTHPTFQLKVFKLPAGAVFAGQADKDTVELEDDVVEVVEVEKVLGEEDFVVIEELDETVGDNVEVDETVGDDVEVDETVGDTDMLVLLVDVDFD